MRQLSDRCNHYVDKDCTDANKPLPQMNGTDGGWINEEDRRQEDDSLHSARYPFKRILFIFFLDSSCVMKYTGKIWAICLQPPEWSKDSPDGQRGTDSIQFNVFKVCTNFMFFIRNHLHHTGSTQKMTILDKGFLNPYQSSTPTTHLAPKCFCGCASNTQRTLPSLNELRFITEELWQLELKK